MADAHSFALVLTAAPGSDALDETATTSAAEALAADTHLRQDWLDPGAAWELEFAADDSDFVGPLKRVRAALAERPVDANIVSADPAWRRKQVLIADMDSTIIGQECVDELADRIGRKTEVSAITERAMRGDIPFEPALRERVALFQGLETRVIEDLLENRITLNPGARELVMTMRAHGAFTALVSGGFTRFTGPVAARAGFNVHRANTLETDGTTLTGTVRPPILGQQAKRNFLAAFVSEQRTTMQHAIAVGDGANDLAMLAAAGLGVAYHAKPAVAEAADARIDHGDLTALLYLQGYRASDIVS